MNAVVTDCLSNILNQIESTLLCRDPHKATSRTNMTERCFFQIYALRPKRIRTRFGSCRNHGSNDGQLPRTSRVCSLGEPLLVCFEPSFLGETPRSPGSLRCNDFHLCMNQAKERRRSSDLLVSHRTSWGILPQTPVLLCTRSRVELNTRFHFTWIIRKQAKRHRAKPARRLDRP
jgi:hypothetical protein